MLKKKLLTIAGALGILACGACFLPPIHNGPPTPPPPPPQLKGIQTVRVLVTDNSVQAHVDTAAIAIVLANRISFLRGAGIAAHVGGDPADADLTVVISDESAKLRQVEPSDGSESWSFEITISESLKNANGEMLKQRSNLHVRSFCWLPAKHADDVWSVPAASERYGADLGFIAMHGMFF